MFTNSALAKHVKTQWDNVVLTPSIANIPDEKARHRRNFTLPLPVAPSTLDNEALTQMDNAVKVAVTAVADTRDDAALLPAMEELMLLLLLAFDAFGTHAGIPEIIDMCTKMWDQPDLATLRTFIAEEPNETDVAMIQHSAGLLVLQDMFHDLRSDTVCKSTKLLQLRLMLRRTAESHWPGHMQALRKMLAKMALSAVASTAAIDRDTLVACVATAGFTAARLKSAFLTAAFDPKLGCDEMTALANAINTTPMVVPLAPSEHPETQRVLDASTVLSKYGTAVSTKGSVNQLYDSLVGLSRFIQLVANVLRPVAGVDNSQATQLDRLTQAKDIDYLLSRVDDELAQRQNLADYMDATIIRVPATVATIDELSVWLTNMVPAALSNEPIWSFETLGVASQLRSGSPDRTSPTSGAGGPGSYFMRHNALGFGGSGGERAETADAQQLAQRGLAARDLVGDEVGGKPAPRRA
jgi:hypothetical protein